jgi:DNA (cytosine-5)-methyltransferase 1
VATARNASASASGRLDFESETFVAFHHNSQAAQLPTTTDTSKTAALTCSQGAAVSWGGGKPHVLCPTVAQPVRTNPRNNSDGGMEARQHIYGDAQVRRLTPTECEKLQNFPTGYTKIPWRGKPAELCPDGPRYKALGNSMCTAVIFWIGQAIEHAAKSSAKGKAK